MIKESGIDFRNLEDEEFDDPMGEATGAGVIFGATGGVMEAALRSVPYLLTGKDDDNIDIKVVRGVEALKEAEVEIGGVKIKAAVVHGLGNARKLLDKVKAGEAEYHFIEIMACPGGCVCGGGQPISLQALEMKSTLVRKSQSSVSGRSKPNLQKITSQS